jgi:hypothetical protein
LNQTLESNKLFIKAYNWLEKIKEGYQSLVDEYIRIELQNKLAIQGQNVQLDTIISQWWTQGEIY